MTDLYTKLSILLLFALFSACSNSEQSSKSLSVDITSEDLKSHITYLADDKLGGREAGTQFEAIAANYIADYFEEFGLEPAGDGDTYFQEFFINTSVLINPHSTDSTEGEMRLAKNVAGIVRGTSDSDEFVIIGAHYDHLGTGDFGSLYRGEQKRIHNGADDNASGTASLLELAQFFGENPPLKSVLFLAFSGEEMGLLGSQYFVENSTRDLNNAIAMINMDMIGRMSNDKLMIFGVGTSSSWEEVLNIANLDSLDLNLVPDGTGSSDHTSFYYKNIPVLHYFTDTHADYHRPSDDIEYINFDGQEQITMHVRRTTEYLTSINKADFEFIAVPGQQRQAMSLQGPTLGILPDYGYDGEGMKITGTSEGRPAAVAGLKSGDIIINIAGIAIADIYAYMGSLNELEEGQKTTITVLRDGEELTLDLQL